MNTISVAITSRSNLDKKSVGTLTLAQLSKTERLWLGGRALIITYGITFFCIFIPMLHFVLVPAGIIVGVLVFLSQYSQKEKVHQGQLICPICTQNFDVAAGPAKWPKREICSHCCNSLEVAVI